MPCWWAQCPRSFPEREKLRINILVKVLFVSDSKGALSVSLSMAPRGDSPQILSGVHRAHLPQASCARFGTSVFG